MLQAVYELEQKKDFGQGRRERMQILTEEDFENSVFSTAIIVRKKYSGQNIRRNPSNLNGVATLARNRLVPGGKKFTEHATRIAHHASRSRSSNALH